MLPKFLSFFKPPVLSDPSLANKAERTNGALVTLFLLCSFWIWFPLFSRENNLTFLLISFLPVIAILFFLLKRKAVDLVATLLPLSVWLIVVISVVFAGNIHYSQFSILVLVIILACITSGARVGIIYTLLSLVTSIVIVLLDRSGVLPITLTETDTSGLIAYGFTFCGSGGLLILQMRNATQVLLTANINENMAKEALMASQEQYKYLEQQSYHQDQQVASFRLLGELGQLPKLARNETEFCQQLVDILAKYLALDYVGYFQIDATEEQFLMRASNSEEGKRQVINNYSLKITASPFIYSSLETEFIKTQYVDQFRYVTRPASLSEAKTNFSIPITIQKSTIGLLNFQSFAPDQWVPDDETTRMIANQVAQALENIRLNDKFTKQQTELKRLTGETTLREWKQNTGVGQIGYQFDQLELLAQNESLPDEIKQILAEKRSAYYVTTGDTPRSRLVAPIILRESVLGVLGYENINPDHEWVQTEISLLETIASRVGLALENSRLVSEAEQRAVREQLIGNISSRMRETLDFDTILQTAIQEIYQSFDLHEAEIRLQTTNTEDSSTLP